MIVIHRRQRRPSMIEQSFAEHHWPKTSDIILPNIKIVIILINIDIVNLILLSINME